ncbi:Gfo/Idh/MocA family protein [Candidatus Nitrospira nitrificans]|uniref:Putative Oxidoreductase, GFO/IDH/MOCA family n=1 Tax=Candidatus Nitrospira nitrificans TaxID=1742973 RepID=A0A0S4LAF1_9BACT|nr:Gfo/Idh/MocA family oxidoreductase [Candidatus Nitrospira nitrificans]CUS32822.1 putative Oxidoreductase, GFO/IDH/MOCA family [Candidatus Nitrospira nitrificans]
MNETRIGVGLIGVGRHGMRYARHLVRDLPTASLRAVCRQHPEQGFDLPGASSVTIYKEPRSLIADPMVDVVLVVTPPIYSLDICRLAVQARKPLLIEKPLATTAADAQAMVVLAREAGVPLMTAQTLRFDHTIQRMKTLRHRIGRSERLDLISRIELKATAPDHADGYGKRGALLEIGVHMLDLVRFLTGEEVSTARCTMDVLPSAAPETSASVDLTTGGTACRIEIARVAVGRVGRAIWSGSQGRLEADWGQRRLHCSDETGTSDCDLPPAQTVLATLTAFLQAVKDGTPMPVTGEDGFRAVEIAEACYRSAQAGGAHVVLDRRS